MTTGRHVEIVIRRGIVIRPTGNGGTRAIDEVDIVLDKFSVVVGIGG